MVRTSPQRPVAIDLQRYGHAAAQLLGRHDNADALPLDPEDPLKAGYPKCPVGPELNNARITPGLRRLELRRARPPPRDLIESAAGHDPDLPTRSASSGGDGENRGIRQPFRTAQRTPDSFLVGHQAARRAGPQLAVASHGQRRHRVVGQRAAAPVEGPEVVAVEARQALLGADPQVTVGGLRDGADGVLRQAVFLGPDAVNVLRDAPCRIQRMSGRRQGQRQCDRGP